MCGGALSLVVSSPKSPNYLASHPIRIRAKRVEDDAHDTETSSRQGEHRLVPQHDLLSRLQGAFPRPVSLGGRAVGWLDAEIQDWLQRRIDASRKAVA